MGTYPWGPHGPQSGPNQVTPNPTPAYVPPPSSGGGGWSAPTYSTGSGGGYQQPVYTGAASAYSGPPLKSYFISILLTALFGPIGLLYASKMGSMVMLAIVAMDGWFTLRAVPGGFLPQNIIPVLSGSSSMAAAWSVCTFWSVVWGIFAVRGFNKASRAKAKG